MVDHCVHMPPFALAVVDVCVLKDRTLLNSSTSFIGLLGAVVCYCLAYVLLIHLNHTLTGKWPYEMLDQLVSLKLWAIFIVTQCGVLMSFIGIGNHPPRLITH